MADKSFLLDPKLQDYVKAHSVREPEILTRLRQETASHPEAIMQISPEQGQLMKLLIRATGAKRALEVGVFTGYSSLNVALALPPNGRLVACDISDEYTQVARRYWHKAAVDSKIELLLGPALDTLHGLLAKGEAESFDFAFIDADKPSYRGYYEAALRLVRSGGLILLDNMLQRAHVVDPDDQAVNTVAIRALNDWIAQDDRVDAILLSIGDGMTLAVKK